MLQLFQIYPGEKGGQKERRYVKTRSVWKRKKAIDLRPKAEVLARRVVPVASKYHTFYEAVINYIALLCHLPDSRSEILAGSSLSFPWRTRCQNILKEWRLHILVWPLHKERNLPTLQKIYMRHVCCNRNKTPKPSQRSCLSQQLCTICTFVLQAPLSTSLKIEILFTTQRNQLFQLRKALTFSSNA